MENFIKIQKGFRILLPLFSAYIQREMKREYGDVWWTEVLNKLSDQDDLPYNGTDQELMNSLDIANCIRLFDRCWNDVFRKKLSIDFRTWAKELMGVRNKASHITNDDFSDDDAWRALDTMARLCDAFDDEAAAEIRAMLREFRYGSADGSTAVNSSNTSADDKKHESVITMNFKNGLPSWRTIIEPHPDVAQGRYKNAEFAADLAQVARGSAAFEYQDPVEFFARTYVTGGMKGLLVHAVKRIAGKDGEPVIQLKTSFGGGKTHSMLALYHLLRGKVSAESLPNVKPVLDEAGVSSIPKVHVAVLVGTSLDPTKSKRPNNFPGATVNTLWGEMAYQLAMSAERPELYNHVKEADKKGVSPGSEALTNLFDDCGSCLILIDELVAYGKKIYGATGLPAGTFDNLVSFVQEITEAARASKNSLIVASIPESDIEIGGEAGKTVLDTIEHTFGRMEAIWKPVAADEGFEVVRRRLFLNCKDETARDAVCNEFSKMYQNNPSDFPLETKELDYRNRMVSCYPIHPEFFDRLYNDWATLERFQRTRGVLRLMAGVIHELWMGQDSSAMIMPGSIPMDVSGIRDELTRYLDETWNAIVDSEVDGKNSVPYKKDKEIPRFGSYMACRRAARTIMLGSAPSARGQSLRGIDSKNIRLGIIQPEESVAAFNDAISTLHSSLAYLYNDPSGNRYWYDTRPTLRKTVEDRATMISESDADYEIEKQLKKLRASEPFSGVHICPATSLDISDEQTLRLVLLNPSHSYYVSSNNKALSAANDFLNNRGTSPRIYKNMIVFVAPDKDGIAALRQETKRYLAWRSIENDQESLNLDAAQIRETKNSIDKCKETIRLRIQEAYCWLLVPYTDISTDMRTVQWDISKLSGGTDGIIEKAAKKLESNEAAITKWAPALLKMELDNLLWKNADHISVKQLWEYLCTYTYLPRLAKYDVLEASIRNGIASDAFFAIAADVTENEYLDLRLKEHIAFVNKSDYLVKVSVAQKQMEKLRVENPIVDNTPTSFGHVSGEAETSVETTIPDANGSTPSAPKNTHFYMSAQLDTTRINRDVQKLVEEVITHLINAEGCNVEISLEVNADAPKGLEPPIVRTVSENCRTLKVDNFSFDD